MKLEEKDLFDVPIPGSVALLLNESGLSARKRLEMLIDFVKGPILKNANAALSEQIKHAPVLFLKEGDYSATDPWRFPEHTHVGKIICVEKLSGADEGDDSEQT